jgi:hypothetical protein
MPNIAIPPGSPFTYSGEPSPIATAGSPTLDFSLSDTNGDSASGTYALTNLAGDGGSGVDIYGNVTINSITSGSNIATFDSFFGLPSTTALDFTLDVGDCKSGSKSEVCIQPTDPTAQFISLNMAQGTPAAVPEPGPLGVLACASAAILVARRWQTRKS